jgi:hypothetical protein
VNVEDLDEEQIFNLIEIGEISLDDFKLWVQYTCEEYDDMCRLRAAL